MIRDAFVELEAGDITPDLAHPYEEDESRGRSPEETSILQCSWTRSRSSAVTGTSGSRGGPAGRPSMSKAAFTGIGLDVTNNALNKGERSSCSLRAAGTSPVSIRSIICLIWQSDEMRGDAHDPDGAQAHVAERRPIVAGVDLEPVGSL